MVRSLVHVISFAIFLDILKRLAVSASLTGVEDDPGKPDDRAVVSEEFCPKSPKSPKEVIQRDTSRAKGSWLLKRPLLLTPRQANLPADTDSILANYQRSWLQIPCQYGRKWTQNGHKWTRLGGGGRPPLNVLSHSSPQNGVAERRQES